MTILYADKFGVGNITDYINRAYTASDRETFATTFSNLNGIIDKEGFDAINTCALDYDTGTLFLIAVRSRAYGVFIHYLGDFATAEEITIDMVNAAVEAKQRMIATMGERDISIIISQIDFIVGRCISALTAE